MGAVGRDRLLPTPGAQVLDRLALPRVALPAVLGQLDGEPAASERAERAAGVDRGELPVVADEDELAARRLDVVEHRGELPRSGHPRLVDDEHDPPRQALAAFQPGDQLRDADRRDRGLRLELLRGVAGDRGAEDREPDRAQASCAAESAKVLPAPARPSTTATAAPSHVSARTISLCSADIVGASVERALQVLGAHDAGVRLGPGDGAIDQAAARSPGTRPC